MTESAMRSHVVWSVITVALFFPALSATLLAICVVVAFAVSLIRRERIPALTLSALAIASASLVIDSLPTLSWFLSDRLMAVQGLIGIPVLIDPSLLVSRALPAYILIAAIARNAKVAWLGILSNLLLAGLAVLVLGVIGPLFSIHFRDAGIILIVLWGVNLGVNWLVAEKTLRSSSHPQAGLRTLITASCALASVLLATSIQSGRGIAPSFAVAEPRIVAIYQPTASARNNDFGTSSNGYGLSRIGLYGDMSRFLERLGYRTAPIASLEMLDAVNPACLYCPTFSDSLPAAERQALKDYLDQGGSLIAVAEHTNLEGSADILNPLLSDYGLKVRFDNTNGLWGEGLTGSLVGRGQLSIALRKTPYLTHNRGASIQLERFRATPLLAGRFWQSDRGDSLYPDRAFLSDGRLSMGDRLGNVALMAESRAGKGRVFVSGDSSPFLNQNLAYNTHFLVTLFSSMMMPAEVTNLPPIPMLIGVVTAVVLVLLLRIVLRSREVEIVILVMLSLLFAGAAILESRAGARSSRIPEAPWAVISTAENNAFERDPFSESAATGLALQVFRSGLLPTLGDWEAFERFPRAIFIINPTIRLSESEVRRLTDRVKSGTRVVIAGEGDNYAFVDLARRFGFEVTNEPVGSASNGKITTFAAWRVGSVPDDAIPLMVGGMTVGGTIRLGAGEVTVIADGGFFLSRNLESDIAFDEGNCAFVRDLLGTVASED